MLRSWIILVSIGKPGGWCAVLLHDALTVSCSHVICMCAGSAVTQRPALADSWTVRLLSTAWLFELFLTAMSPAHCSILCCLQVNLLDWVVFNVALFATMFAGVDLGLAISIGLSIILALYKSAFPKTSVLGQLPETNVFRWAQPSPCAANAAPKSACTTN